MKTNSSKKSFFFTTYWVQFYQYLPVLQCVVIFKLGTLLEFPEIGYHDVTNDFDDLDKFFQYGGFHPSYPEQFCELHSLRYQIDSTGRLKYVQSIYQTQNQL